MRLLLTCSLLLVSALTGNSLVLTTRWPCTPDCACLGSRDGGQLCVLSAEVGQLSCLLSSIARFSENSQPSCIVSRNGKESPLFGYGCFRLSRAAVLIRFGSFENYSVSSVRDSLPVRPVSTRFEVGQLSASRLASVTHLSVFGRPVPALLAAAARRHLANVRRLTIAGDHHDDALVDDWTRFLSAFRLFSVPSQENARPQRASQM